MRKNSTTQSSGAIPQSSFANLCGERLSSMSPFMRPRLRASLFSGGARARDPCALERKEVEFVAPPEEPLELRCLLAARGRRLLLGLGLRRLLLGLGLRRLLLGGRPLGDEADVVPHPILLVLAVAQDALEDRKSVV